MEFRNFKYTKKKNGETKGYLILVLEENQKYLEGLDLGKLSEQEIDQAFRLAIKRESLEKSWSQMAHDQGIELSEYIAEDNERQVTIEEINEQMKPFVKKAYRKFIKENIQEAQPEE